MRGYIQGTERPGAGTLMEHNLTKSADFAQIFGPIPAGWAHTNVIQQACRNMFCQDYFGPKLGGLVALQISSPDMNNNEHLWAILR